MADNNPLQGLSTTDLYKAAAIAEGYESVPVDIDTFLNDPYYLGQIYGNGQVYPYWLDALHKVFPNPLYSPYEEVCLSGDTEVDLLDGTTRTMAQLCRDFQGKTFWVLAFNMNTKEWEPRQAYAPMPTGVKPVYKITLDNGKSFKATGNHKVLGKDNRWHRVDSLKVGQSLMPYNLEYDKNGYAYVWDNATQQKVPRRKVVQNWKYSSPHGNHIHHKNQIRNDDRPCNLMSIPRYNHFKYHSHILNKDYQDPEKRPDLIAKVVSGQQRFKLENPERYYEQCVKGGKASWAIKTPEELARFRAAQKEWVNSDEGKNLSAEKFRKYNATHKKELQERAHNAVLARWSDENQRVDAAKKMTAHNKDAAFQAKAKAAWMANPANIEMARKQQISRNADPEYQKKAHKGKILKGLNRDLLKGPLTVKDISPTRRKCIARNFDCLDENGFLDRGALERKWPEILEQARNYNHRIVSIEELPPELVFNFTVDKLHNYVLSSGLICSNCITGCIGAGKTSFALMGALYDLYHVTLLKDPHKKYKLLSTTSIIFSLVTATMDLAAAVMANQFLDAMGASPYFCSKFNPQKGERLDEDMFPHHVGIGYGSRGGHNLGKAVIGAIIDEANFQDKVADQAVQNYNTITRRMKSRFMLKGGSLPCRRWLVSSRNDSSSFLESHIDAVRNDPKVIIFEPAIWDVQSYKGIYSGKTFPVFIGSDVEQPKIITTEKEMSDYIGRTIQVPIEYYSDFETNLPGSLQDLAGVATRSGVNLIYNVEAMDKAMCLENCMTNDELQLSLNGPDQIQDFYKGNLPPGNYYVHLDGGVSHDRFGFAMSRVTESITVNTTSALNGVAVSKISPSIETPLVFGIKALPGSQVPFWKVRVFLGYLRSNGVHISLITCDGYQSVDMIQLLTKMGFNTKYASVDKTKDPYLKLSSNIMLGLIKMPKSKILRNELINLQNLPKKIDHPITVVIDGVQQPGGKDVSDAVASSSFEAVGGSISLSTSNILQMQKSTPTQMTMKQRQDYIMKNFFKMGRP